VETLSLYTEALSRQRRPWCRDGGLALSPDGNWLVFAELDRAGSNIQLLEPFR
jgi:hypothetical protein